MANRHDNADRNPEAGTDQEDDLHARFIGTLLDRIGDERFPSNQFLDLLEASASRQERAQLASVLIDKLATTRYPSLAMLRRLARIVG
jgi:hypothetical protein